MTGIHQEKVFEAEMLEAMGTHGWQVGTLKPPAGMEINQDAPMYYWIDSPQASGPCG